MALAKYNEDNLEIYYERVMMREYEKDERQDDGKTGEKKQKNKMKEVNNERRFL